MPKSGIYIAKMVFKIQYAFKLQKLVALTPPLTVNKNGMCYANTLN